MPKAKTRLKAVPAPSDPAPEYLRAETRDWVRDVSRDFLLEHHHRRLLLLAAEAYDRAAEARETIQREGPYYDDRFEQPRAHPALAVERDSRIAFARLVRELGLEEEPRTSTAPLALKPRRR
jgi:P27 family predicted phage terminase small subunit